MELDTIGDEKTVLFLIMSDTDTTFNFILAMLQSQLINLLCDRADDKYGGRLPVHVRLILDEFANIGQIPNFDKLIATIRSREISASIILQSQSQLKAIYKDAAEIISDNCDSVLFLWGRGKNAKEISDALGKETIDSFNTSENRGSQTSHGLNYQKLGKALMSEDEIAIMDGGRCILQLRGVRPFFSEKFDITKHPHYKYLADADKKNTFDVDRFLSTLRRKRQQVVAQDESFDLYEIDLSDENARRMRGFLKFLSAAEQAAESEDLMEFFNSAVDTLQTIVVGLGGALCVWGGINLLEGYGQDNPGSKSQGVKQLVAGGGVALIGVTLVPLLSGLLG